METTRREFLRALGTSAVVIALNPLELIASESRDKISVDGYVHRIPGDRLSDSFHKDEQRNLWVPVYNKVRDFYSNDFDIKIDLREEQEVNERKLDRNHVAVEYTTMDEMLNNPRDVLYAFGGQEFMDGLEAEIKRAQKAEGWDYKTAEAEIFSTLKEGMNKTFSGEGGFGSKISHRAWILPSKTYDRARNDEELVNAYAFSVAHEIGHVLSLEHPIGSGFFSEYGQHNFMNPTGELKDIFSFNFDIHPDQVRQIKQYLRTD